MLSIAIAHGSPAGLRALERAIGKSGRYAVLWRAHNGELALAAMRERPPELLLVDWALLRPSAVEIATKVSDVCPVVILQDGSSAATSVVYDAMAAGAIDVATCPKLDAGEQLVGETTLLAKLRSLENILLDASRGSAHKATVNDGAPRVVLIGSSTGGPQALQTILSGLPTGQHLAYVVAQHLDEEFSGGLADWLRRETGKHVRVALSDDQPEAGLVLLAGSNDHLVLNVRRRLVYTQHPMEVPFRPSADALFSSFVAHWTEPGVAVLLTGMGKDGARGLLALRRAGWHTIAQDAATSVVFGMPKAAIALGAACEVVALPAIAEAITRARALRRK